jgi:hypothetical protein
LSPNRSGRNGKLSSDYWFKGRVPVLRFFEFDQVAQGPGALAAPAIVIAVVILRFIEDGS